MKNILKRVFIFSIVLLLSVSNVNAIELTKAIKTLTKNSEIEIYEIKTKKEEIVEKSIVELYETDPNKQEVLDYIAEQKRLEQERLAKIELRNNLVNYSKRFVGNPYVLGGNSLINGIDCSGFVKQIYAKYGYDLPRTTFHQAMIGNQVGVEEIEPGDIVSYGYDGLSSHSAIYIGNGKIVHASTPEFGIIISDLNIMPIVTIRRVI